VKRKSKEPHVGVSDWEGCVPPPGLTGAFERYRQAIPERRVVQMLGGQAAFSRQGPLSAWVVIWLMIFQRLDSKGTLSAAMRQLLTGGVRAFVPLAGRQAAGTPVGQHKRLQPGAQQTAAGID